MSRMIPNKPLSFNRFSVLSLCCSALLLLVAGFGFLSGQSAEPVLNPASSSAKPAEQEKPGPQTGLPEADIAVGSRVYHIEVAVTPEQAETGLMYRTSLPQGHGMLFPFKPPRPVSFWMKNTKIPLDILFVKDGRLLRAFQDIQPCLSEPCPTYGMPGLIDMVLELPAGTARQDQLVVGMPVEVRWPVPAKSDPAKGK